MARLRSVWSLVLLVVTFARKSKPGIPDSRDLTEQTLGTRLRRMFSQTTQRIQARVVQKKDNFIHPTNHYPVVSMVCFVNTYPVDSDLSGG